MILSKLLYQLGVLLILTTLTFFTFQLPDLNWWQRLILIILSSLIGSAIWKWRNRLVINSVGINTHDNGFVHITVHFDLVPWSQVDYISGEIIEGNLVQENQVLEAMNGVLKKSDVNYIVGKLKKHGGFIKASLMEDIVIHEFIHHKKADFKVKWMGAGKGFHKTI